MTDVWNVFDDAEESPEPRAYSERDRWGNHPSDVEPVREDDVDLRNDALPAVDVIGDGWGECLSDRLSLRVPGVGARQGLDTAAEAPTAGDFDTQQQEFVEIGYLVSGDPTDASLGFEASHVNQTLEVRMPDGEPGYLKPMSGEDPGAAGRDNIPDGSAWRREVASFELDRCLQLGVVPTTVPVIDDQVGPASLQECAPLKGFPLDAYAPGDIDRMAVLDYVCGNTDRHEDNYRSFDDGRPAAIDNGYSFPMTDEVAIRSPFVVERLDQPISANVLDGVRAADLGDVADRLAEAGVEGDAIQGCIDRLREIQEAGRITGEAWKGGFRDGDGALHQRRGEPL